ncbi:MAG: O-antigen ligase domain-containing protein [Tannerellaceae bacterium]|jgi:hypothetical protein|nr:O-antigen ligase domain-containing protein [Tannerellaceae bacterium]
MQDRMTQTYINKYFYLLFLFTLAFGIVFYNLICVFLKFDYTDEVSALLLFILFSVFLFTTKDWEMNKVFLATLFIFLFYLFYSFYIQSNTGIGIFSDLFIQIKPYLAFFCVYSMTPRFDRDQKSILKSLSLLFWGGLFLIGIASLFQPDIIKLFMFHETYYAAAVITTSLCYFYCSSFSSLDKLVFLLMLSIGIFSGRSKFYGFYALSVFVILFFSNIKQFRWNFRNILILLSMLAVMTFVAWEKIYLYFYQSITDEVEKDMIARYVLYVTSPDILRDYFPFGSGFASYATHVSGLYYSHIYTDYGIDGVWGLSRRHHSFVADTYYPSLVQFGVAGIVLYILFWVYICKRAFAFYGKTKNIHFLIISILIVGFLGIEGTSDSTFISNRGVFVMMLLGLILAEMKQEQQELPGEKG